jgi:hypothetical protein
MTAHRNLSFSAEDRFLKFERHIFTQIGAALCPPAPATSLPKNVAHAEQVAENLAEILEAHTCSVEAAASAANPGMAEAIIERALLAIAEHGIGFAGLFELFFSIGVVRIAIRVKLQGKLPVGALDLLFVRPAFDSQDFVVVAFYVAGQNCLTDPFRFKPLCFLLIL